MKLRSAGDLDVLSLCPWPVGVANDLRAGRVLIVKATYALPADGIARLVDEPDPLLFDYAAAFGEPDELDYASDFAPPKSGAEVLLVGHAHALAPTTEIEGELRVDGWSKRFVAVARDEAAKIPLVRAHLRMPGPGGGVVQVGPRRDRRGAAAPPDQRLEALTARSAIELRGLLRGAARRSVTLPGVEPIAFGLSLDRTSGAALPLRADTLWIDCDRAFCTLTWRGLVPVAVNEVVVAVQWRGERLTFAQVARGLARATIGRAFTLADALVPAPDRPPPPASLAPALPVADVDSSTADEPVPRSSTTIGFDADPRELPSPLPFRPAKSAPDDVDDDFPDRPTVKKTIDPAWLKPPLPFVERPVVPVPAAVAIGRPASVPPPAAASHPPIAVPPAAADESLSLEVYATIKAEVWKGGSLTGVLDLHGLSEARWRREEARRAALLAREASEGKSASAQALGEALRKAKQQLQAATDGLELDAYVDLRARIEDGGDAGPILAARGLSVEAWQREHAAWSARATRDAETARVLRDKLAAARRKASS